MTDFRCLAIKSFEWFKTFEWHWIQANRQQLCMKTVDVRLKSGYINSPPVGGSHRCSVASESMHHVEIDDIYVHFMSTEDRLLKSVVPYFAALRPCSVLLRI